MKRIVWLTDIHLNFLEPSDVRRFLDVVAREEADAVLIGGDFSESHDVIEYLQQIDDTLSCPVYFVLGNHDFYFGSIVELRQQVAQLCRSRRQLHYLTKANVFELAPGVGLVGHDGWADARIGDYERSLVMMNDYKLISELAGVNKRERWPLLKALGDEAAAHIRRVLPLALEKYDNVFLLTHVPPLREACWHEGQISDDEWAPHFTCQAMGEAILDIMRHHTDKQITVLCGHTHGAGETHPLQNVQIITGSAEYGNPRITRVFEL